MTVVEGRQQTDVGREQHAVAEHIARHVADADTGEILTLAVAAESPEMPFHRLPSALGGDAHAFVVVADGAAGCEGIAQPEAVFGGNAIGDIGEGSGAFVGRDHQVRIIAVVSDHLLRMHDLAIDQVVGDVEQSVDEAFVTGDAFGQHGIAIAAGGGTLGEKSAFRADRNDDGVLDHLRLDQSEDFGTEVFTAVRPAQSATRDRSETQMHAFDERRVNEDFAVRNRFRNIRHLRGIEFETEIILGFALTIGGLVETGAQGRFNDRRERPQDTVLIKTGDLGELLAEQFVDRADLLVTGGCNEIGQIAFGRIDAHAFQARSQIGIAAAQIRIETRVEQADQNPRHRRITLHGFFHVGLRERNPDLQQVFAISAKHGNLAPAQTGRCHQSVESVVLALAFPDRGKCLFEVRLDVLGGNGFRRFQCEILDDHPALVQSQHIGILGQHFHAEVFKHRQRVGKRDLAVEAE